jgi:7-cyano-7-deazaguanine synthase in queuosine biosynthesis
MVKAKTLIMFSGGLDSTGVLWKLIHTDKDLYVHHLYLANKENRAEAEDKAVKSIIEYIKKIRDFSYSESYHEYPSYNGSFMWDSDLYNFIAGTICLSVKEIEEVAIGRTKSDAGSQINNRAARGTKIFESFDTGARKVFPVKDMTKKEIYDMLPEDLRKLTWSCRTPIYLENDIKKCGKCKACNELKFKTK